MNDDVTASRESVPWLEIEIIFDGFVHAVLHVTNLHGRKPHAVDLLAVNIGFLQDDAGWDYFEKWTIQVLMAWCASAIPQHPAEYKNVREIISNCMNSARRVYMEQTHQTMQKKARNMH